MQQSQHFAADVEWCESCGGRMVRSEDGHTFRCMPCGALAIHAFIKQLGKREHIMLTDTKQDVWSLPCGCTQMGRCAEGNALWESAYAVYRGSGYDAWMKALEPFNAHVHPLASP